MGKLALQGADIARLNEEVAQLRALIAQAESREQKRDAKLEHLIRQVDQMSKERRVHSSKKKRQVPKETRPSNNDDVYQVDSDVNVNYGHVNDEDMREKLDEYVTNNNEEKGRTTGFHDHGLLKNENDKHPGTERDRQPVNEEGNLEEVKDSGRQFEGNADVKNEGSLADNVSPKLCI